VDRSRTSLLGLAWLRHDDARLSESLERLEQAALDEFSLIASTLSAKSTSNA
jgi:hypothetical protein